MSSSIRKAAFPVILCALSLCLFVTEFTGTTAIKTAFQGLLAPAFSVLDGVRRSDAPFPPPAKSDPAKEARLQFEIAKLTGQVRDLSGTDPAVSQSYKLISTRVLYLLGWEDDRRLAVLDRGREDGLEPGQGVIKGDHALGRILRCGPHHAVMRFLSDPGCKVPATLLPGEAPDAGQTFRFEGLLEGRIGWGRTFQMKHVPCSVPVAEGDSVLTSGRLGTFPAGLVAGCVFEVDNEDFGQFHNIRLVSDLPFRHVESVLVALPVTTDLRQEVRR